MHPTPPRPCALFLAVLLAGLGAAAPLAAEDGEVAAEAVAEAAAEAAAAQAELDAAYASAMSTARKVEGELVSAVAKVRRSSVSVLNQRRSGPDGPLQTAGCGSGVLVEQGGKTWVLTNVHVIEGAAGLEIVTHDGEHHTMVVQDTIPTYDIALLAFEGKTPRGLVDVRVKGRVSEKSIREGTWVIATGNPFFLALDGSSVTTLGVVSGTGRMLGGRFNYVNAVQHDAEVNPGNSGGPVWTLKGELVGLNGMIMSRPTFQGARPTNTGASFALPAEQLEAYLRKLTSDKDARSGFLGVQTSTFTDSKGKAAGAEVTGIAPQSPVSRGSNSLQEKDVITHFGAPSKSRIYTSTDLQEALSVLTSGTRVTITYKRGRSSFTWKGELGEGR